MVRHGARRLIVIQNSFFILLAGIGAAILILQVRNNKAQQERIDALEAGAKEQLGRHAELLLEADKASTELILTVMGVEIPELQTRIAREIAAGTTATGERIRGTNNQIREIAAVYAELLAAQNRRTLDSLYTEAGLAEAEQEAARLFREGNYAAAGGRYAVIAQARPENREARFYRWYSLFLSNRMDRANYWQIKEGLRALEQSGYHREELREAMEYIEAEENGLKRRTGSTR